MTKAAMRLIGLCLTVWVLAAAPGSAYASNGDPTIEYTVKAVSPAPPVFHVTCEVKGIKAPTVDFSLPTYAPGLPTIENFARNVQRSEEHTSELQSPYVISYAVFCL